MRYNFDRSNNSVLFNRRNCKTEIFLNFSSKKYFQEKKKNWCTPQFVVKFVSANIFTCLLMLFLLFNFDLLCKSTTRQIFHGIVKEHFFFFLILKKNWILLYAIKDFCSLSHLNSSDRHFYRTLCFSVITLIKTQMFYGLKFLRKQTFLRYNKKNI